jgi:benzoate membrane transport protein
MLRVLQAAFVASFKDRFTLGALVAFLVTVADLGLWNIALLSKTTSATARRT